MSDILELSVKSPCLGPASTPISSFSGIRKVRKFYSFSAFNAQGSRVILIIVQVRAVKKYVAVVEALRRKERQDETQFTSIIAGKTILGPSYFVL
jgi:hypothetical protein